MTYEDFLSTRLRELLRFAVLLCGDRGLAEDVVQDVLIRAHQQWGRIGDTEYPFAYVRKMLVNEHLSWRRKWARQIPTAEVAAMDAVPDHADHITDRDDLISRLQTLPARQRAAVVMRYFGGLTDVEIADALGCTAGTVRGYLSRALATMRVQLATDTHLVRKDA